MSADARHDVIVVGGGPGGSTAATFLARAGRRVLLFERDAFPRFHEGESLLPATLPILDRLGVHERVVAGGVQVKYGAAFSDEESGLAHSFDFLTGKPWPSHSYQVVRGVFDTVLLDHARTCGVDVRQPATVESVAFDAEGVTVTVVAPGQPRTARARFLIDASGRAGFLARQLGRRARIPNLGKVALFAHWRGAGRAPGREEGHIRLVIFDAGWFWFIPLAGDLASVGAVMHARTVRAWAGDQAGLYASMIGRCREIGRRLAGAERVSEVHAVANFSYVNEPIAGDRFLAVGDAIAFVDPIFSGGVHIAMQSGELAARAVDAALTDGRFQARRFRPYARTLWGGLRPFFKFIHKYYEPAFLELFLQPRARFGMLEAVLSVLSGGAFLGIPWRLRASLALLFAIARVNVWVRRRAGRPVESRLEW
jgi:flavin-dependent dehydrogenase